MNSKFDAKRQQHIIPEEILLQASQWQARLWAEDASEDDQHACLNWRQAHPDHEQAWQLLNGFNQQFEQVPKQQQKILLGQDSPSLTEWIKKGSALCAILGIGFVIYQQHYLAIWTADYSTKVGEIRHIQLSDGTQLVLASNSAVDFDANTRKIDVLKGQIFVETGHKYPHLPALQVHSNNTVIQPLGTQFTVKQSKKDLAIAVYEGAVKISSDQINPAIILKSGWQVQFNPDQPQINPSPADSLQLAWIRNKLVVEQIPLCDFLKQVSEYHRGYIHCDQTLQTLKVSGTYSLDNTQQILEQMTQILPVQLNSYSDYIVTVKAK
ncbi:FecR family protein [Acinetobacter populi]|jgi:transmembrane sensor|uniref:Iron dicitrate transport regulator FecR n=1 Tax=Acinetobacter populi TaxID=1582270 RepID=A0A1Z9YVY1_9GAMM|nr:FecR domain-containing protein [Acinetobacter populi]MCH4248292.1 FecR domain-containing protein [Acinetobacter populi]OUY06354.1 hypothetical protein CAP51_13945 [Acinetobacter populi]